MVLGEKTTTIRRDKKAWLDIFERNLDLHIYYTPYSPWRDPGGTMKKVGTREFAFLRFITGENMTNVDAQRDGFDTSGELVAALAKLNGMSVDAAKEHQWAVVHFGRWIEGPDLPERCNA